MKKFFNLKEVRHLSANFAISCLNGYNGSFDDWFNKISPDWRKIANKKTLSEIRKEKLKKLLKNN